MAKMIGYYGNGQPKYDTDEQEYQNKGWSPSYNPNPYHTVNFEKKNEETFYYNNGVRRGY
jgi:hypothetical protein